ncbi:MAG: FkbM family methyltransferase [Thermoplasmatales archaeon]|nr:MAG: FkbM family methyltransferase [Thermoplasmatales archaeon]
MICIAIIEKGGRSNFEKKLWVKLGLFFFNIYIIITRWLNYFIKLKPMKIERYGKSFFVSRNLEYLHLWGKSWERNTYKIIDKFVDPNYSYIDIGAFIGATVLYGAPITKKVYAIEPDPIAFKELNKNVSLNPMFEGKIELHEKCINSCSGKVKFGNIAKGGDSGSSLLFADSKTSWIVDGITFDEFINENEIKDCNFIKMDIEGGEAIVLPSMKNYLKRNKPVLYLSAHPPFFKNPEDDTRKIIDVLKIYRNIYSGKGEKIELNDLLGKKRLKNFYAIVATDKEWD